MEIKVLNQKKNPFLHREEFILELSAESTPSFDELKKEFGKGDEVTVIKRIENSFGKKIFKAEVFVYDSVESKNKVEVIPKKIRKKMEEERKAADEAKKKEEEARKKAEEEAAASEVKSEESEKAEDKNEGTKQEESK